MDLIWFKRDLRLEDHEPLSQAQGRSARLVYIFEPSLVDDPHYHTRHWIFVWQALMSIQEQLSSYGLHLEIYFGPVMDVLPALYDDAQFDRLLSYEETGLLQTFERDQAVKTWCQSLGIQWLEFQTNAVIRGLKSRDQWQKRWYNVMTSPIKAIHLNEIHSEHRQIRVFSVPEPLIQHWGGTYGQLTQEEAINSSAQAQPGNLAKRYISSFFQERGKTYHRSISKPLQSRRSCSRLSPYLAWGMLSLRQVYQAYKNQPSQYGWGRPMKAFASRLHWHCHFIQKFESEHQMEWRPLNRGYEDFPWRTGPEAEIDLQRWLHGQTGFPLVDAVMRCLNATGYVNFRMRAMVVSFACHCLQLHWQSVAVHLAPLFLDFEPGIHYAQVQMQASITGINTVRIYNPLKQSFEHDPDGDFIREWVPELAGCPSDMLHDPSLFEYPAYPKPMVNLAEAMAHARTLFWGWRKHQTVLEEKTRIVSTHVVQSQTLQKKTAYRK